MKTEWQSVPKEPTEEMEKAARIKIKPYQDKDDLWWACNMPKDLFRLAYKAMLAAAPKPEQDTLMNKAIDRMSSLVPDEISVINVLVGLRDFADRPDYCPKVMKAKLSECIDNLQKLYHEPVETSYDKEVFDLCLKVLNRLGNGAINQHVYGTNINAVREDVETIRAALNNPPVCVGGGVHIVDGFTGFYSDEISIHFIGYNSSTKEMRLEFKNGEQYNYQDVPEEIFKGIAASEKRGQFLAEKIKGYYRYYRVNGD